MAKSIKLGLKNWSRLNSQLSKDYPSSYVLIREKMKDKLGFTVRRHREWEIDPDLTYRNPIDIIYLDFYNEPKRTMFLLKYSEFLDKSDLDI